MTSRKFLMIAAAAAFAFSGIATANPILQLSSGGSTVQVADGGAGDVNPLAGAVTFIGAVGNWGLNVTTGLGSAVSGGEVKLDLSSVNAVTTPGAPASGPLTIMFTEQGFTDGIGGIAQFLGAIGGTTEGTISWFLYVDSSNAAFGMGNLIASSEDLPGLPFSDSEAGLVDLTMGVSAYSVTLQVVITHFDGPSQTSFDFTGRLVPEPATLLLIGLGLVGLAIARRKVS